VQEHARQAMHLINQIHTCEGYTKCGIAGQAIEAFSKALDLRDLMRAPHTWVDSDECRIRSDAVKLLRKYFQINTKHADMAEG
jgi:hypothetical protein